MKKTILFEPGFDYTCGIPRKDPKYGRHSMQLRYGRHSMQIRFGLQGSKGAVSFLMFTSWFPRVKKDGMWKPVFSDKSLSNMFPMAADIGYHSPKPMYEGQRKQKNCPFLKNKECYYDGSALMADEYMAELINKGHDALWKKMELYYKEQFL